MSFELVPFTELLSIIVDNRGRTCPVGDTGIPLIATNCIDSSSLYPRYDTTRYVSDETYRSWFRGHPMPGDILFVCKGSPGRTNWVPDPVDFCIAQDMVSVRANPEKIYSKYLFAALRSSVVQTQIDNMHVGTMIPHFKKGDFSKLNIPVPSRDAQRVIGDFYFTLSERIALLRETNATLEAMAQALFKSWFVDFDPVHANAGTSAATLPADLQALFPSTFTDTPQGLVPEGWNVIPLGGVATVVKGKSYTSKELADNHTTALVTLKSFARGGGFRMDGFKPYSGKFKPEQVVEAGDLIVAYTDVTQAAELIGKPALVVEVAEYDTLVASLDVGIVRPKTDAVSRQFLYGLFCTEQFQAHTYAHTSGTTVLHLAKDAVASYEFACPSKTVIDAFSAIADSMAERKQVNADQISTLATLRDTLLPRLISGQLRLPDAVAALAEAGA